ncbi:MAG TPA: arylsulfotransferase family protein [Gaiellaceae bacterium]|nr:arylsulfotransferase family protein [Gaiellaceae bacterium]
MTRRHTRREFLAAAAAGIGALSVPGLARAALRVAGVAKFVTQPSFEIPTISVKSVNNPQPGYVFVTTLNGPGQRGPIIFDNAGQVVWFRRTSEVAIDFRRQIYQGKPVLTWWEGQISQIGTGQGDGVIVDRTYTEIARVKAGNGYFADVHEFLLTPQGTALITIYDEVTRDLTSVGGAASAPVLDSIVQEIDVKSGAVLFEWHSLDHVPFTDSYAPLTPPYDYFHVNSVGLHPDGNFIISARNTSAIYKVSRTSGEIIWTLNGRSSDFEMGPAASFMYQHDAQAHLDGTVTLYDDGPGALPQQSRAIRLGLDLGAMQANLLQSYTHPGDALASFAMGNAQQLPNGGVMVGWGTEPWLTEFGPLGDVRFDATFDGGAWNYRTFRNTWDAKPKTRPAVAVHRNTKSTSVYASWNGSTDTAFWAVHAGPTAGAAKVVKTVPRTGFETAISIPGTPHVVWVTALDAKHRVLRSSATA